MSGFEKKFLDSLDLIEKEYDEYETMLESVEIMTDNKLFQFYQKKLKAIEGLVHCFKEYKKLDLEKKTNEELISLEQDDKVIKILQNENIQIDILINKMVYEIKEKYYELQPIQKDEITIELSYKTGDKKYIEVLFDIFRKYQENNNFLIEVINKGEENIVFKIIGKNLYQYLKYFSGNIKIVNHGLESIFYIVVLKTQKIDFEIKEDEVEIETLKSGGAGGQHINKTESAIRLVHKPTGISVVCQDERSQLMNKKRAFEILEKKIRDKKEQTSKNDIIFQRKNIKNALFSSTPSLLISYDKNNVYFSKTQKYYNLKEILDGDLQIIWGDLIIDG